MSTRLIYDSSRYQECIQKLTIELVDDAMSVLNAHRAIESARRDIEKRASGTGAEGIRQMVTAWSAHELAKLTQSVVLLGRGIKSTPESTDARTALTQLRTQLEWRVESPAEWSRRILTGADAKLQGVMERLVWVLHPVFRDPGRLTDSFFNDIGQIAWDLRRAIGIPPEQVNVWVNLELERVWQSRPSLPHLHQLGVHNFRCFRSVQVNLRPLTVLIGRNDTGKSAFLDALQYCINGGGLVPSDNYQGDPNLEVSITGSSNVGMGGVAVNRSTRDRELPVGIPALQPVSGYHFPSTGVPMTSEGFAETQALAMLSRPGDNIAGILDHLLRLDRDRFFGIRDALKTLIPGLMDINIASPQSNSRRVDLVLDRGYRIPAERASTGVRLLIAFVTLAFHPVPPRVILLEEPESGVHPRRLGDILHILRELTNGKYGQRAAQVILTTHSPYLLDSVDLETDQVLVFRREEDGSRSVEPADPERLKVFLDEFKLGEVWFNQEEEGLVRKKA